MAQESTPKVKRAGLRRDPEACRRVLGAALERVREIGFARLTNEQFALASGAKGIDRRCLTRAELAGEAIFENVPEVPQTDTGCLSV